MTISTESTFMESVQAKITEGSDLYKPLEVIEVDFKPDGPADSPLDADLVLGWQDRVFRFVVEIKSRTAPSVVQDGIQHLDLFPTMRDDCSPMLLVPYLSNRIIEMLERSGMSGIDPNGNYFIQVPDLLAIRLDRKNQYPESSDIKKIYSRNSSIVGRFMLRENRTYDQVNDIYDGIKKLGGGISLSTVSKVLQGMKDDLVIEKGREGIRVLQPEKLLEELSKQYRPPIVSRTLKLKLPDRREEMEDLLSEALGKDAWMWTGESSAEAYTMTTPARMYSTYTRADSRALDRLAPWVSQRFYNCELKRTKQAFVYFDCNEHWSSPLECYLALSQLDKREREIALDIKEEILDRFS